MNRYENYETSKHRAMVGVTAIALTALTLGLSLVVPAKMTFGGRELSPPALSKAVSPMATEVAGAMRIDVIAVRDPNVASAQIRNGPSKHKQPG